MVHKYEDVSWSDIYFKKHCKKDYNSPESIQQINLKISDKFVTNLYKLSDIALRSETMLYKSWNNYWNDHKHFISFKHSFDDEITDIIQNMFSNGLNYCDNKDFNIELTNNIVKAFDYFNIGKDTYKDDFKFLIKLIVSIWQGNEMQNSSYEKFKILYSSKTSYVPLIMLILCAFRVITPQRRWLPSQSSYDDICKIIRTCLDKSLLKKEVY